MQQDGPCSVHILIIGHIIHAQGKFGQIVRLAVQVGFHGLVAEAFSNPSKHGFRENRQWNWIYGVFDYNVEEIHIIG